MNKERYLNMKQWFCEHKKAYDILRILYKILPLVMVAAVPALIIIKGFMKIDMEFFRMIYVPLIVLIEVTILRKILNRPRPYEVFETAPVINRDGKGESFPSRHTASAFIIAMCAIPVSIVLTIILLVISIMIALTRIFSGVHHISDVIAGMLISVITGLLAFVIM